MQATTLFNGDSIGCAYAKPATTLTVQDETSSNDFYKSLFSTLTTFLETDSEGAQSIADQNTVQESQSSGSLNTGSKIDVLNKVDHESGSNGPIPGASSRGTHNTVQISKSNMTTNTGSWVTYGNNANNGDVDSPATSQVLEAYKFVTKICKEQMVSGEPQKESRIVFLDWGEYVSRAPRDKTTLDENRPEWIIRCLKDKHLVNANDKIKLLYIVSDGTISNENAKKSVKLNRNMHYEKVVFHAINKVQEKIDLSVGASFFKSRCIVYRNNELCYSADISKKFDYEKINNDNFAAEKDQLKSYIKLKFINQLKPDAGVWQEIVKLTMLRDRLCQELASKSVEYLDFPADSGATKTNVLTSKTDGTDSSKIFEEYIEIHEDIKKTFAAMLEYIENNKNSYSFDALKFDTKVDKPVAEEPMDEAGSTDNGADYTDDDAVSIDDDSVSIDDDAVSLDDDADSIDDDADSMDDDADSMDDDADSIDDGADSMDNDANSADIIVKSWGDIDVTDKNVDIMDKEITFLRSIV